MSFPKFLEKFDVQLHKEFKLEQFREKNRSAPVEPLKIKKNKFLEKIDVDHSLFDGIPKLSSLNPDHMAVKYFHSRKLPSKFLSELYYVEKAEEFTKKLDKYKGVEYDSSPRILIPFYSIEGDLTHVGLRSIECNVSKLRYITLSIIEDSIKVFNAHNVNWNDDVYVCEGQFDSMFLNNSVAMGGSDIPLDFFEKDKAVFVYDNEPRSKEIVKRMNKVIERGYRVCVWGSDIHEKDINEMVLSGYTPEYLNDYIHSHTFQGLKAKMKMIEYKKV
jgi:hypothetical protein